MKTLTLNLLLSGAVLLVVGLSGGCGDTPAYTGQERFQQDARNTDLDLRELADDSDIALLIRPSDTLTYWDVYHRN
jgi:hypothetical protein